MLIIIDIFTCFETKKKKYILSFEAIEKWIQRCGHPGKKLPHAVVTPSQERHKVIKVMTRDIEFGQM